MYPPTPTRTPVGSPETPVQSWEWGKVKKRGVARPRSGAGSARWGGAGGTVRVRLYRGLGNRRGVVSAAGRGLSFVAWSCRFRAWSVERGLHQCTGAMANGGA